MPGILTNISSGPKMKKGSGEVTIEAVKAEAELDKNQALSASVEGTGYLRSEVVSLHHKYPFRFMLPENCTPSPCRWIYPMTFGGGLVGGDIIKATVTVGDECACIVTSQESTKVYHCNNSEATHQDLVYNVGDISLLCVLPDPVVCYKGANFHQTQITEMTAKSNLVFFDWMLSGRNALSESWSFQRYINRVEIKVLDEVVLCEVSDLVDTPYKSVAEGMMGFQVCGMCVVLGDKVKSLSDSLVDRYSRKRDIGERSNPDLVVSVSEVTYTVQGQTISGCYLRLLATSTEQAAKVIHDITSPLMPLLGADPYKNKL